MRHRVLTIRPSLAPSIASTSSSCAVVRPGTRKVKLRSCSRFFIDLFHSDNALVDRLPPLRTCPTAELSLHHVQPSAVRRRRRVMAAATTAPEQPEWLQTSERQGCVELPRPGQGTSPLARQSMTPVLTLCVLFFIRTDPIRRSTRSVQPLPRCHEGVQRTSVRAVIGVGRQPPRPLFSFRLDFPR